MTVRRGSLVRPGRRLRPQQGMWCLLLRPGQSVSQSVGRCTARVVTWVLDTMEMPEAGVAADAWEGCGSLSSVILHLLCFLWQCLNYRMEQHCGESAF